MSNNQTETSRLYFLKLGGSLITDKSIPRTPRPEVISRISEEIAAARKSNPELQLVLGHGSGSFGHVPASKYGTRRGVYTPTDWRGFAEVWYEASTLNRIVMEALYTAGLHSISFSASGVVTANDGRIAIWDLAPINACLEAGLLPVVFGDVAFDAIRGGTILSTEDIFNHLAYHLKPNRVLFAGIEKGVWADYPNCKKLIAEITPKNLNQYAEFLGGSAATDVTGGMASKVQQSLSIIQQFPELEVQIFSGNKAGAILRTLSGKTMGTVLRARKQ
jgi:isopentenyl phosphate kinase